MRTGKGLFLALTAALVGQAAWAEFDTYNQPPPTEATETSLNHVAADAGNQQAGRSQETRDNNNTNLWGGNARVGAPQGTSGITQPRSADDLPAVPKMNADGSPVMKGDKPVMTKDVPPGYFIESTPFLPNQNPAGDGFTRHQVTGRFTDFSPKAQDAIKQKLDNKIADMKSQGMDTSGLEQTRAAMDDPSQRGNVFIEKGTMDASNQKGGDVRVVDLGRMGLAHPPEEGAAPVAPQNANLPAMPKAGSAAQPNAPAQPPMAPANMPPTAITSIQIRNTKTGQTETVQLPPGSNLGIQTGPNGQAHIVPMPRAGEAAPGQMPALPMNPQNGIKPVPIPNAQNGVQPVPMPNPQNGVQPVPMPNLENGAKPAPMPQLGPAQGPARIMGIQITNPRTGRAETLSVPPGLGLIQRPNQPAQVVPLPQPQAIQPARQIDPAMLRR